MKKRFGFNVEELTFGQILAYKADKNGDRTFVNNLPDGRKFSYGDVDVLSNCIADGMSEIGISYGDHVAVFMENCPEQLLTYFALGKLGSVAVPLNTAARGHTLQYFINQAEVTAMVISQTLMDRLLEIQESIPTLTRVIVVAENGGSRAHYETKLQISYFHEISHGVNRAPKVQPKFSDLASIMYTSGTTGPSKGNLYTQANTFLYGTHNVEQHGFRFNDVFYVCLPLFHCAAMHGNTLPCLMVDAQVALVPRFSVSRFWSEIRSSGSTLSSAMGSMINMIWSLPPSSDDRMHSCRLLQVAPMPPFALQFEERFGIRLISGYGSTDFGHISAFTPSDPVSKLGSCGRPTRGVDLRIIDDDDFEVPKGQPGEIAVRTDDAWSTPLGYYKMPEATIVANRNRWFHTGDRGYLDEDGYLYFVDRKKDAIRRRGENVSSFEVESVILTHPSVLDVAVYPIASELAEDEIVAAIELKPEAELTEIELIEHCQRHLAYFMIPRFVHFVSEFPRTLSHKVEKHKLTQAAEHSREALWDRDEEGIILKR